MKTIKLSLLKTTVVVLLFTVVASACKKEPVTPPRKTCELQGNFIKAAGFDGYYGDYAIRLQNGTILYPCIVTGNTVNKDNIYEEMPVSVSYTPIVNEEIKCSVPYNPLFLPEHAMYRAKITCISEQQTPECGTGGGWCGTGW